MDDFNDDLWGEDDIDEALLIEASQQVEFDTIKNERRSRDFHSRNETVNIDEAVLTTLIPDEGENNKKENDAKKYDEFMPKQDRFMQTQTVFKGLDGPSYKNTQRNRPTNTFHNSFNDTKFSKPPMPQKQKPKYPNRSTPSFNCDGNVRSAVNESFDQGHNRSLLSVRSYSNNEIEDIIAELEKLKAENKQLTSNKYTKSGEISVLRDEMKKVEIKLDNERQERLKLCDKKSLEIAGVEAKAKIQIESMKSERDFIARELELAKEVLRKKDKKIKDVLGDNIESPNKRIKLEDQNFYQQDIKSKKLDIRMKNENGIVPQTIDRSLCGETRDTRSRKSDMKDCSVQTIGKEKRPFMLEKNVKANLSDKAIDILVREQYQQFDNICSKTPASSSKDGSTSMSTETYSFLIAKLRSTDAYLNDLNEIRKLFHLLVILVNNGCLQESELKELLIEIKSVLRTIIKRMTEVNRKHKSHAESSSLPNEDSKKNETSGELILNTKDIFIHNMNFLMESLHFLEVTCEVTSWHLCTNNKEDPCFIYFVSFSVQQLFAWWRTRKRELNNKASSKDSYLNEMQELARTLYSWLAANYKLIHKYGTPLPWLMKPEKQPNDIRESSALSQNNLTIINDKHEINKCEIRHCTECKKDLIDIMIYFLFESVKEHTESEVKDPENTACLIGSACAVYLHKIWSADPQKFATCVALNPRTQRKFVWSIAQLQRLKLPSQSILTKVLEELSVEVEAF